MRAAVALILFASTALATKTIDGVNPPDPLTFSWNAATKTATLLVDLAEPIVITGSGVTLDGDGHSVTGTPGSGVGIDVAQAANVTLKNCTVTGWSMGIRVWGTAARPAPGGIVEHNTVTGNVSHGIFTNAEADGVIVRHNTVTGTTNRGIEVSIRCINAQVLDNTVTGNATGILLNHGTGHIVRGNSASGNSGLDIWLHHVSGATVEGNTGGIVANGLNPVSSPLSSDLVIHNNNADDSGIDVQGDRNEVTNNSILRAGLGVSFGDACVIRGNIQSGSSTGIRLGSLTNALFENNTANDNSFIGVELRGGPGQGEFSENITMRGNTANGNGANGYRLSAWSYAFDGNFAQGNGSTAIWASGDLATVENNTLMANAGGIRLDPQSPSIARGNTITGPGEGIQVFGQGHTLDGNTVTGSASWGARIWGSGHTIKNNTFEDGAAHGLDLRGDDLVVEGNECTDNGLFGIHMGNGGANVVVRRNTTTGNTTGIRLDFATDCLVEHNTSTDNSAYGIRLGVPVRGVIQYNTTLRHVAVTAASGILLQDGVGTTIRHNDSRENKQGLSVRGSGLTVQDNTLADNLQLGLHLDGGTTGSTVTGNTVTGNARGISVLSGSSGNTIYNNLFNNVQNVASNISTSAWNVPVTPGPNIVGGPSIGGNFWGTPTGTGHSQTCTDANADGFCDQPFVIDANNIDNLPLVLNTPPSCNPSGGGTYELGSTVTLGGSVADNDGDLVSFEWRKDNVVLFSGAVQTTPGGAPAALPDFDVSTLALGLGTWVFELVVDDSHILDPVVCELVVDVVDGTPPTLAPDSDCDILWPPQHQMVTCTVQANASDNDGQPPTLTVTVTSSEPDNGLGDGDAPNDIQNLSVDEATGTITVDLRAERSGGGNGRIYTITITATDGEGNSSVAEVTVLVPHSQGKGK